MAKDSPSHDRLPIVAQSVTTTTYTVGCSCGWRYQDAVEEWAETMLQWHQDEEAKR